MNTEKFQIVLADGQKEIIIREGNAVKLLDPKAPIKVAIVGTIGAPLEFLSKRFNTEQIEQKKCHIIVDREAVKISLIINEDDDYLRGAVVGQLEQHPKFKEFGINSGKLWQPNQLGQFLKMNRSFFKDLSANMTLVTQLKSYIAKINVLYEKENAENGAFKDNYSGVVESNLPSAFMLKVPIFKGVAYEEIEVEFYTSVDGRNVSLQLFSPSANQLFEELRDTTIDNQLKDIKALCPDIAIIEQ
jgi:hypothetical protein